MLEYKNVTLSCDRKVLLSDISLQIPKDSITTFIGPNGCGKTTILQALNGSTTVTSGSILLEDEDYLAMSPRERARRLSFLPQIRNSIPTLTVKTLIEHGRFPYLGFTRRMNKADREIVEEAMEKAGVAEYRNQSVDTLSGGVRQRVFLAMQLAQDCKYLVADEPTTFLDFPSKRNLLDLYCELKSQGKTVILVLHDLSDALEISDRLIVCKDRKIAAEGTPEEILSQQVIESVFNVQSKIFKEEDKKYIFFR